MKIRGKTYLFALLGSLHLAALAPVSYAARVTTAECEAMCARYQSREVKNSDCKVTPSKASASACGCRVDYVSSGHQQSGGACFSYVKRPGEAPGWLGLSSDLSDSTCGIWSAQGVPAVCKTAKPNAPAPAAADAALAPVEPKSKLPAWDPYRQCYNVLRHFDGEKGPDPRNVNEVGDNKYSRVVVMPVQAGGADEPPPGVYVNTGIGQLRLPPPKEKLDLCGGKTFYVLKSHDAQGEEYRKVEFGVDWKAKYSDKTPALKVLPSIPEKLKNREQCVMEVQLNKIENGVHSDEYQSWDSQDEKVFKRMLLVTAVRAGKEKICRSAKWCENVMPGYKEYASKNCSPGDSSPVVDAPAGASKASGASSAK